MITLYGAGPAFGLPDGSPYVMKTEAQLRMAGLPYQKERAELAVRAALPGIRDVRNLIRIRPSVGVDEVRQRMKDERRRIPGSVRTWAERRSA